MEIPSKSFSSTDDIAFLFMVSNLERSLWENGKIEFLVNGRKENDAVKKSYSIMLKGYSYRDSISINQSIAAGELTPDYYEAVIRLMDSDGNIIDSKYIPLMRFAIFFRRGQNQNSCFYLS